MPARDGHVPGGGGMQVELMAKHMNKDVETISRDIERPKYFNPYEAVEYGIIDRVRSASCFITQLLYDVSAQSQLYALSFLRVHLLGCLLPSVFFPSFPC